jgi:hypothetical protein
MAEISAALARAIARGDAPAVLFYCDHPTRQVYAHTRTGIIRFDNKNWYGFWKLGRITGATRSVNLSINEITFELRGVPSDAVAGLSGRVRNRVARAWFAAVGPGGRLTVDDEPTIDARLDYQRLSVDPSSGTASVRLTAQQGFWSMDRAQDLAWSNEQQRAEFPADCGLALVHQFENRESNWRATN